MTYQDAFPPQALAQWGAARELHAKETRYSYNEGITSAATEAKAREDQGDDVAEELHTFDVCAECGRIELEHSDEYEASVWPCPTAKVLGAVAS